MKKAMISQPMRGLDAETILKTRDKAKQYLESQGYGVVDTFFDFTDLENEGVKMEPVYYLGKSIQEMSKVDLVYFCNGWDKARGCQAEHFIAKTYGLKVVHEDGR